MSVIEDPPDRWATYTDLRPQVAPGWRLETIVGPRMPSLTYMLVYEDMEMRDRVWRTFATMPEWRELSSTPGFTDPEIVTSITNVYLRPAAFSEI